MVGVACTGEGLLSGADPAWARGSPQHPWGLCRKHTTPPACQSRCASGILSFPICKMGCLFHKSYTNHRGPPPGCPPCLFLPILSEAKEAQPTHTFRIPPRPNSLGKSERGPLCPDPAHQGGAPSRAAGPPEGGVPPPSSAELSGPGKWASAFTLVALCGCKPALMPWERRGPLSEAVHK